MAPVVSVAPTEIVTKVVPLALAVATPVDGLIEATLLFAMLYVTAAPEGAPVNVGALAVPPGVEMSTEDADSDKEGLGSEDVELPLASPEPLRIRSRSTG